MTELPLPPHLYEELGNVEKALRARVEEEGSGRPIATFWKGDELLGVVWARPWDSTGNERVWFEMAHFGIAFDADACVFGSDTWISTYSEDQMREMQENGIPRPSLDPQRKEAIVLCVWQRHEPSKGFLVQYERLPGVVVFGPREPTPISPDEPGGANGAVDDQFAPSVQPHPELLRGPSTAPFQAMVVAGLIVMGHEVASGKRISDEIAPYMQDAISAIHPGHSVDLVPVPKNGRTAHEREEDE